MKIQIVCCYYMFRSTSKYQHYNSSSERYSGENLPFDPLQNGKQLRINPKNNNSIMQ